MSQSSTDYDYDPYWATKDIVPEHGCIVTGVTEDIPHPEPPKQTPKTGLQAIGWVLAGLYNRLLFSGQAKSEPLDAVEPLEPFYDSNGSNHNDDDDEKQGDETDTTISTTKYRSAITGASVAVHRNIAAWERILDQMAHEVHEAGRYVDGHKSYRYVLFREEAHDTVRIVNLIAVDQGLGIAETAVAGARLVSDLANAVLDEALVAPHLLGGPAVAEAIVFGIAFGKQEMQETQVMQAKYEAREKQVIQERFRSVFCGLKKACRLLQDDTSQLCLSCTRDDLDLYLSGPMQGHVAEFIEHIRPAQPLAEALLADTLATWTSPEACRHRDGLMHRLIQEFKRADACIMLAGRFVVHAEGMRRSLMADIARMHYAGPHIFQYARQFVVLGDVDGVQKTSTDAVASAEAEFGSGLQVRNYVSRTR